MDPLKNDKGRTDHLDKNTVYIMMDEVSLANRMALIRGFKALDQVEYMLVVTAGGLKVPERKREFYSGTNRGNVISPVILRPLSEGWTATFKDKKEIYGKSRRAVGGAGGVDGADGEGAASSLRPPTVDGVATGTVRPDDAEEPVFYKVLPPKFYRCLFTSLCAKGVVDCTAGDGSAALSAIEKKIPYFGVCLTDKHTHGLQAFLVEAVLGKFLDEKSPLFQAKFAALRNPVAKAKAKATTTKATVSSVSSAAVADGGDDDEDEEEDDEKPPPKKKAKKAQKKKGSGGSGSEGSM